MSKLKQIDEAWLGLDDIDESTLFNPMSLIDFNANDFQYKLTWLMSRPEYFSFICKHLLNIQILPMQAVILYELWNRKFPMLIGSRGLSKSFCLSLYALLRAILLPKRKVIVVGAAFRQSKVLFEYMETIWNNAPILRDICDSESGPRRVIDRCEMRINESRVTCLPLGTGDKIRGQRANDILADEFSCLDGDTLVETDSGLIRIKDFETLEDIDPSLPTGSISTPLEKPAKFIKTPLSDVYEIKFRNGYTIKCSPQHKLMTTNGWKTPTELSKGDFIETSDNNGFKFGTRTFDRGMAWLMGMLISEGSITDKYVIGITTTDQNTRDKLIDNYNFNCYTRPPYIDDRGWICKESYCLYRSDRKLREKLFDLGLDYVTAHDKVIPKSILTATKDEIQSFLSGLFDGDGSCFTYECRKNDKSLGLAYYSVSERLCRDVQVLMNKLGYDGYINNRISEISDNLQWFVRWNGLPAKLAGDWLNVDRFKEALESGVVKTWSKVSYIKKSKRWKTHYKYINKDIQKTFKTKEEATLWIKEIDSWKQYKKVVSVKLLDYQDHLYDYYLPITNSFYADGFRQHNSIPRDIFETVVAGFAAVSSDPISNVKRLAAKAKAEELGMVIEEADVGSMAKDNQIILSGTAYYDFNHFAQYWKKWKMIIESGGDKKKLKEVFGGEDAPKDFDWKQYSIMRIPYDLIPEGFMDAAQVARSKATVHTGVFDMEFNAIFAKDSLGFFKRSLIESCVCGQENPIIDSQGREILFDPQLRGDPTKKYIFGVDPASEIDKFSIIVLEVCPDHRKIVYCWTTNKEEHRERVAKKYCTETDFYSYCARKIRDLMKMFPCIHIAIDAGGGGIAIDEALHDKDKIQEGELPIWRIIDPDKESPTDDERGLHIIEMCQFSNYAWASEANHGLRKDFEDKVVIFPKFDAIVLGLSNAEDSMKGRLFDTLEDCVTEIEELKDELAMIQMTQTPTGKDHWGTPEFIIGVGKKGRVRKDRYSALLMANMSARTLSKIPNPVEYSFYGGFATLSDSEKKKKDEGDFVGAAWFVDAMKDVY